MIRWHIDVVDERNGDDLSRDDVLAPDAEEAQIQVAEELAQLTGIEFDVVAAWVGTAVPVNRYA